MARLKQCLGVDLGFHTVKIVEISMGKDGPRVIKAESAPTGAFPGMSSDDLRQALVATTKDLLKKGRFSTKKAVFAISGDKFFTKRFRLPKTTEERLARIIQYEARQQIPFPLDKTILQYEYRDIEEEGEVEVLLSAVRTDEARAFMQTVNKTGLTAIAVGVSSFALFNAQQVIGSDKEGFQKLLELKGGGGKAKPAQEADAPKKKSFSLPFGKKKQAEPEEVPEDPDDEMPTIQEDAEFGDEEFSFEEVKAYINIGATCVDLAVGQSGWAGLIPFNRTIMPHGGNRMTEAIQKACDVESFGDAERIKASATQLMTFNFDYEEDSHINTEASEAVTEAADKMITEIRRSLDFYITQPDGMAIDSILLSGGQSLLPGMSDYLEEKLTMPVTLVDSPPEESPLEWPDSLGSANIYYVSIGLALQGLGVAPLLVDFLPEDRKIIRDFPYRITVVMFVVLIGIIAVSSRAGKQYSETYRKEAESLRGAMVRDQSQSKQFDDAQKSHDAVAELYLKLDKSFGQRDYWLEFLAEVSEVKPPGVLILDIRMDHAGEISISGQSEVSVDAARFTEALKAQFTDRLEDLGAEKDNPTIEDVNTPPVAEGGVTPPTTFLIKMVVSDKINHLDITPTPTPTPVGGGNNPGAFGIPSQFGGPNANPGNTGRGRGRRP